MRIFITGGSGFIGTAVIRALGGAHEFVALSRSAASDAVLQSLGARPVRGDLEGVAATQLRGCEALVHCAAHIGPGGDRAFYQRINVAGTERLLAAARAAGVRRFVHLGTEAGCFRGQHLRDIDESCPLVPDSPYHYPATKAQAELAVLAANDPAGGLETLSLRPRLVWGPGDRTLLPGLLAAARRHAPVLVDGGRHRTSTTHVDNVVHGVALLLEGAGRGGEAYFVTDGPTRTFREVVTALLATQGLAPSRLALPGGPLRAGVFLLQKSAEAIGMAGALPINRFSAALLARECTIRIDKARRELGYAPVTTWEEGLARLPVLRTTV